MWLCLSIGHEGPESYRIILMLNYVLLHKSHDHEGHICKHNKRNAEFIKFFTIKVFLLLMEVQKQKKRFSWTIIASYLYLHAHHHQLWHRNLHPIKQLQWQKISLSSLTIQGSLQHAPANRFIFFVKFNIVV